jgi:hypothetical protein
MLKPQHAGVRMVSERIDATINGGNAAVRCDFLFENDGEDVTVRMGFPVASEDTDGDGFTEYPVASSFGGFRSWVNGKRVKTRYISPKNDADNHDGRYWGWYVKDVRFRSGEAVRVVDRYSGPLQWWDDQTHCYFGYILQTGKNWKGRIGRADITVTIAKLPGDGSTRFKFYLAEPKPCRIRKDKITWAFRDFEPSDDIDVGFKGCVDFHGLGLDGLRCDRILNGITVIETNSLDGAAVTWDRSRQSCTFQCGNRTLRVVDKSRIALVNGKARVRLPLAAKVEWTVNGPYFTLPIAAVVRALGGTAFYDAKAWEVYAQLPQPKPGRLH